MDDPYSHLAVQKLDQLKAAYALPFVTHLVAKPTAAYQGSQQHFDQWALRDVLTIAADYGTTFEASHRPSDDEIRRANDALAPHLAHDDFARTAIATGSALWTGTAIATRTHGSGATAVETGNALRQRLGHYAGGMFYFEGEWFWGIDRIRSLERRLIREGFARSTSTLCVPEPVARSSRGLAASGVVLEYFPSLRSPYTAIGHQRVADLVARSGVTLQLRPVMPMLMRGIPAPFAKQQYIIIDAGREARERGVPFGRIVDPFGEPVKRAFALFPAALALDKGMAFVGAYLAAAWANGIDITTDRGLQKVAAAAGIDWGELRSRAQEADWQMVLDANVEDMLDAGLWGVPSFRVTGGNDAAAFACWGQDRIWRVENEIVKRVHG
ncbi:MAG: hypothetical protein HC809_02780 [Gammaproteobacteria bacterium]|nr:hypothetical protein [Gammaproteobacteria bacterium]